MKVVIAGENPWMPHVTKLRKATTEKSQKDVKRHKNSVKTKVKIVPFTSNPISWCRMLSLKLKPSNFDHHRRDIAID